MRIFRKDISEIDENQREDINQFIEENNGLIFHETKFNEIVSESFDTGLSYLVAYKNGELAGICPMHTIKKGFLKLTYSNPAIFEVPYGGWVFDNKQVSIQQLLNKTNPSFNEHLTYWSNIQTNENIFFTKYSNYSNKNTAIIDLNDTEENIFMNYISKNTRHNIKRSYKKGVSYKILSKNNFYIFEKLSRELKENIGLKKSPKNFYRKLFDAYYKKNKIFAFIAIFDDEDIAGILNIGNKNFMHAWIAGRASYLPKNIYQNEQIWWESIKWAKNNGSCYYDLCVVEQERLPHIARFKLGFSKNIVPFYHLSRRPISFRIISRLQRCFIKR